MEKKRTVIQIKIDPEDKAVIEKAAKAMGQKTSGFIRFAALSLAKKVKIEPETKEEVVK